MYSMAEESTMVSDLEYILDSAKQRMIRSIIYLQSILEELFHKININPDKEIKLQAASKMIYPTEKVLIDCSNCK